MAFRAAMPVLARTCTAQSRTFGPSLTHSTLPFYPPTLFPHPQSVPPSRILGRFIRSQTTAPSPPPLFPHSQSDPASRILDRSARSQKTAPRSPRPTRWRGTAWKWSRRILVLSAVSLGASYLVDRYYCGSSGMRSVRVYNAIFLVTLDYKLYHGEKPLLGRVPVKELHRRNAQRMCDVLQANSGLYLKIGQAIAMQVAVLPQEFQRMFATTFDNAPQNAWSDVEHVFHEDFGTSVEALLGVNAVGGGDDPAKGVVDRSARASASIAQVHWAWLANGREVAIKVQKREIAQQVWWDLWMFRLVLQYAEFATGLPVGNLGGYITDQIMLETDFENEARNAARMADLVAAEPGLRDRVYIPETLGEFGSKRVMVTEWIDGVQLWDKEAITAPWRGDSARASPPAESSAGLGLGLVDVMNTVIDLFAVQLFVWGVLHCGPHPGNIFVRRLPSGKPQVVLLDHGLYVTLSPTLRKQYCRFWKAMLTYDNATLLEVSHAWGLKSPDATANALLLRPYKPADRQEQVDGIEESKGKETSAERQARIIREAGEFVGDEDRWPREFIFIERNLGIIQANNRFLGSPVNRIKRLGLWASRGLHQDRDLDLAGRMSNLWQHTKFRLTLFTLDMMFYASKVKQYFGYGDGFEEDLKAAEAKQLNEMKDMIREVFQVEL